MNIVQEARRQFSHLLAKMTSVEIQRSSSPQEELANLTTFYTRALRGEGKHRVKIVEDSEGLNLHLEAIANAWIALHGLTDVDSDGIGLR